LIQGIKIGNILSYFLQTLQQSFGKVVANQILKIQPGERVSLFREAIDSRIEASNKTSLA
jgi:hypothetical protein